MRPASEGGLRATPTPVAGIAGGKRPCNGVRRENLFLGDSRGVIHRKREDLDPHKRSLACDTPARTLAEAMMGAAGRHLESVEIVAPAPGPRQHAEGKAPGWGSRGRTAGEEAAEPEPVPVA